MKLMNIIYVGKRKDGSAEGLTGKYLEIEGDLAIELIDYIIEKSKSIDNTGDWEPKLIQCKKCKNG